MNGGVVLGFGLSLAAVLLAPAGRADSVGVDEGFAADSGGVAGGLCGSIATDMVDQEWCGGTVVRTQEDAECPHSRFPQMRSCVAISGSGNSASDTLAVSATGTARCHNFGGCIAASGPNAAEGRLLTLATGPRNAVQVSTSDDAEAEFAAVSLNGNSQAGTNGLAASGTGDSESGFASGSGTGGARSEDVAVTVTGQSAQADGACGAIFGREFRPTCGAWSVAGNSHCAAEGCTAASLAGNSHGYHALSAAGDARGQGEDRGRAVTVWGDASDARCEIDAAQGRVEGCLPPL